MIIGLCTREDAKQALQSDGEFILRFSYKAPKFELVATYYDGSAVKDMIFIPAAQLSEAEVAKRLIKSTRCRVWVDPWTGARKNKEELNLQVSKLGCTRMLAHSHLSLGVLRTSVPLSSLSLPCLSRSLRIMWAIAATKKPPQLTS